jgi:hypothetical protein
MEKSMAELQQVLVANLNMVCCELQQTLPIISSIITRFIEIYSSGLKMEEYLYLEPEHILGMKIYNWIVKYSALYQRAYNTNIPVRTGPFIKIKDVFYFLCQQHMQYLQIFEALTKQDLTDSYLDELSTINSKETARKFLESLIGR